MRGATAATAALLASPPPNLQSADLFTFTLADGVTVYRWTSYDRDLTVNGDVYSSRKPWLRRSRWSVGNTMSVPTLEITLLALNDGFSGGSDIKSQITNGLFDGASAALDRVFFLPGTTIINDVVEETGGGTTYTTVTTVNLDAISNAATSGSGGLSVGIDAGATFAPSDIVRVSLPTGQTYVAWSPWGVPSPANPAGDTGSTNRCHVIPDATIGSEFAIGSTTIFDGYEAARAAFGQQTFTGFSTYKFYIQDDRISDNSGGLSILVEKGTPTVIGTHAGIRLLGGNVGNIDITGNSATITVKGKSNLLDQYAPRNLYQLGCNHAFCDAGCTLSRAAFTSSHSVGSSPSRTFIPWSGSPPANASNFRYGTLTMTSGACSGQARTVRSADSTGLTLIRPLVGSPSAGDSFTAFEGCDKARSSGSGQDCTARSNTQNWRAFPFVPPADNAF